jgi:hypothetical protein
MTVKESRNQIRFIAVDVSGLAPPHEITQQGLSDFGIRFGSERLAQHSRRDGHVQQVKPAVHPRQSVGQFALGMA